jgi:hypothetical protein
LARTSCDRLRNAEKFQDKEPLLQPSGWPMAMAPPCLLTLRGSILRCSTEKMA